MLFRNTLTISHVLVPFSAKSAGGHAEDHWLCFFAVFYPTCLDGAEGRSQEEKDLSSIAIGHLLL
jgi:hypothetical protein